MFYKSIERRLLRLCAQSFVFKNIQQIKKSLLSLNDIKSKCATYIFVYDLQANVGRLAYVSPSTENASRMANDVSYSNAYLWVFKVVRNYAFI